MKKAGFASEVIAFKEIAVSRRVPPQEENWLKAEAVEGTSHLNFMRAVGLRTPVDLGLYLDGRNLKLYVKEKYAYCTVNVGGRSVTNSLGSVSKEARSALLSAREKLLAVSSQ